MVLLKPKEIARRINAPPQKISLYAKDIENAHIYTFNKTALGSFLFEEKDIDILKEYGDLLFFFRKKSEALTMLKIEVDNIVEKNEKHPEWTKHMYNANFVS